MKIVREETLFSCGKYAASEEWKKTRVSLYKAIREVDWPRGSGKFTIYPEKRVANGVTPIKIGLMEELRRQGWKRRCRWTSRYLSGLASSMRSYTDSGLSRSNGRRGISHRVIAR